MLGNDSSRQSTYANLLQNNGVPDFTEGCMPVITQSLALRGYVSDDSNILL